MAHQSHLCIKVMYKSKTPTALEGIGGSLFFGSSIDGGGWFGCCGTSAGDGGYGGGGDGNFVCGGATTGGARINCLAPGRYACLAFSAIAPSHKMCANCTGATAFKERIMPSITS